MLPPKTNLLQETMSAYSLSLLHTRFPPKYITTARATAPSKNNLFFLFSIFRHYTFFYVYTHALSYLLHSCTVSSNLFNFSLWFLRHCNWITFLFSAVLLSKIMHFAIIWSHFEITYLTLHFSHRHHHHHLLIIIITSHFFLASLYQGFSTCMIADPCVVMTP